MILMEKQPENHHYSNTRLSGGGYHSPDPDGDFHALKEYAKAMFSCENLPWMLEGEQSDISDELAQIWAEYAPKNEEFMKSLDSNYMTIWTNHAAFPGFPGAKDSKYAVARSTYTGKDEYRFRTPKQFDASQKEAGEAFHACLLNGIRSRNIRVHYGTRARELMVNENGEVIGVKAVQGDEQAVYIARRAVVITSGGYEYNREMRRAFLEGPGVEGYAFYGTTENTGDGIEMALKIGAGLSKIGNIAVHVVCAIPARRHGLKIGLNTPAVGKPNEIVVDNFGSRYAAERKITKDPSRYIFYKEAIKFDIEKLIYPRIPSWMIFDETLRERGSVVRVSAAMIDWLDWGEDNIEAIRQGWILKGDTIEELAEQIRRHPDNRGLMDTGTLVRTIETYNRYCAMGHDPEFMREPETMGPVSKPPFYAISLYPGGPNTKGGLKANAQRQVLDWSGRPIPRLYTAGEIASVFKFVYQGGGNLAECITFGRVAGRNAASEKPWK